MPRDTQLRCDWATAGMESAALTQNHFTFLPQSQDEIGWVGLVGQGGAGVKARSGQ